MKNIPLHTKIFIGMLIGIVWGVLCVATQWGITFTNDFITPLGTIFIKLLQMIAIPLVLASLITGISSLNDVTKLSRIGGKTIVLYLLTTAVAITVGLILVNLIEPGMDVPENIRQEMHAQYEGDRLELKERISEMREGGPLRLIVDMVPKNVFEAFSNNGMMLQVVFFAVMIGIALIKTPKEKSAIVVNFFDAFNDVIIKVVHIIMWMAPVGVMALLAGQIISISSNMQDAMSLLWILAKYTGVVLLALIIMVTVVYASMLRLIGKVPLKDFIMAMRPVQLVAFSTSSSSATLPLTMEQTQAKLGVSKEVSSFVLPLGATINMDGTSLYQGIAAVFICQFLGYDLTIGNQLTILFTALLASIGAAGVPGAGIIMLVIVLESIGVPSSSIALILAPDRLLDMCRTVVNVTGDATVATIIDRTEQQKITSPDSEVN